MLQRVRAKILFYHDWLVLKIFITYFLVRHMVQKCKTIQNLEDLFSGFPPCSWNTENLMYAWSKKL